MADTWDADDLPESYWILATVYGFRFVLDLEEGARVGALLDGYQEGGDHVGNTFLLVKDYTGAPFRVSYAHITAVYMSTTSSRAFDAALPTDSGKRGWEPDDDS